MKETPLTGSTVKSELDAEPVAARIPLDWNEFKDLQEYRAIYENDEGDATPQDHMINLIEVNHLHFMEALDRAVSALWSEPHPLRMDALAFLAVLQ